jgi:hypothetical protein
VDAPAVVAEEVLCITYLLEAHHRSIIQIAQPFSLRVRHL